MVTISSDELNSIIEHLIRYLQDYDHSVVTEAELVKLIVGLEEKQDI